MGVLRAMLGGDPHGPAPQLCAPPQERGTHPVARPELVCEQLPPRRTDHQNAIGIDLRRRRFQARITCELGAMEERNKRQGDH
jgi:hypothetical protein